MWKQILMLYASLWILTPAKTDAGSRAVNSIVQGRGAGAAAVTPGVTYVLCAAVEMLIVRRGCFVVS